MHITRCLHVAENVLLQLGHWLQRIWNVLVLLNVTNDFCGLGALCEVDEFGLLDYRWNTIVNEDKIGEIDT